MSRTKSLLTATAIVMGSSAALLTGGIAQAEPAPPAPSPIQPGINMFEQLIDPAKAPQLLQQATAMLTGLNAAPPAAPAPVSPLAAPATPLAAAASPLATATVNLPQPATALPGTTPLPGALPAAAAAAPAAAPTLPGPLADLPIPTDLSALFPAAGIPAPNFGTPAAAGTAPAAVAPVTPMPSLFPTSALP